MVTHALFVRQASVSKMASARSVIKKLAPNVMSLQDTASHASLVSSCSKRQAHVNLVKSIVSSAHQRTSVQNAAHRCITWCTLKTEIVGVTMPEDGTKTRA